MKTCSKCGDVKKSYDFYNNKQAKDGKTIHCKLCMDKYKNEWQKNNPKKCSEMASKWNKNNPNLRKTYLSKFRSRSDYDEKNRISSSKSSKLATEELKDNYVKSTLLKLGFNKKDISNELIETQRIIIKTKRLCKTSQN
jgi:hypothetical protein